MKTKRLQYINTEKLIYGLRKLSEQELDSILDKRDLPEFEKHWIGLNNSLEELEIQYDYEGIFTKLSQATGGHEICSYIVDDLELISKATYKGVESLFLAYLISSYENGEVPFSFNSD